MKSTPQQRFDALLKIYSMRMPPDEAKRRALVESGLMEEPKSEDSAFLEQVVSRNVELKRQLAHAERRAAASVLRAKAYRDKFGAALTVITHLSEALEAALDDKDIQ